MHSIGQFLLVALVLTLAPGPTTALVLRVAARDGRRAALGAIVGNEIGVLAWAVLSALGVSALIVASEVAYDVLRYGGAAVLIVIGVRSLIHRSTDATTVPRVRGWRIGLLNSAANPKLAIFFVALFPQFLSPGTAVLPAAIAMALVVAVLDFAWYGVLTWTVDRAGRVFRPKVRTWLERTTGAVMVALGVRVAIEG